jgi:hypothetical protein
VSGEERREKLDPAPAYVESVHESMPIAS